MEAKWPDQVGILYRDSRGEDSNRVVTVHRITPHRRTLMLDGFCHEAEDHRSFRANRISAIYDPDTGDDLGAPSAVLSRHPKFDPNGKWTRRDDLTVTVSLRRAPQRLLVLWTFISLLALTIGQIGSAWGWGAFLAGGVAMWLSQATQGRNPVGSALATCGQGMLVAAFAVAMAGPAGPRVAAWLVVLGPLFWIAGAIASRLRP